MHEHLFQSVILTWHLNAENVKLTGCVKQQHELGIAVDWHTTDKARYAVAVQRFWGQY
jgi:hypothetical protein